MSHFIHTAKRYDGCICNTHIPVFILRTYPKMASKKSVVNVGFPK